MMRKYRALLWEQLRVAGVITAWCFCVGELVHAAMLVVPNLVVWHENQMPRVAFGIMIGTGMIAAALLTVQYAGSGRIAWGLEPRLARLPITTPALVAVPLLSRLACLGCLYAAFAAVHFGLYREIVSVRPCVFLIEVYLLFQAFVWAYRTMSRILVPFTFLLAATVYASAVVYQSTFLETVGGLLDDMTRPLPGFVFIVCCGFLIYWGVLWDLHEVKVGILRRGRLLTWLDARMGRRKPFRSPHEAQVWYEKSRTGWRTYAVLFPCALLFGYQALSLGDLLPGFPIDGWQGTVFIILLAVTFVAGAVAAIANTRRRHKRSDFDHLRPITADIFAYARVLARIRALAVLAAFGTALPLGALLFSTEPLAEGVRAAILNRELGLIEILPLIFGPFVVLLLAAWLVSWTFTRVTLYIAAIVLGSLLIFTFLWEYAVPASIGPLRPVALPGEFAIGLLFIAPVLAFLHMGYRAVLRGLLHWSTLLIFPCAWLTFAALVYFAAGVDTEYMVFAGAITVATLISGPYLSQLFAERHRIISAMPPPTAASLIRTLARDRTTQVLGISLLTTAVLLGLADRIEPTFVRRLREDGYPTTVREVLAKSPPIPDDENAANVFTLAYSLYDSVREWSDEQRTALWHWEFEFYSADPQKIAPEILGYLRTFVERNQQSLQVLQRVRNYRACRFPPITDGTAPYSAIFGDGNSITWKSMQNLFEEGLLRVVENDREGFLNTVQMQVALLRLFRNEPSARAIRIQYALMDRMFELIVAAIRWAPLTRYELDRLRAELCAYTPPETATIQVMLACALMDEVWVTSPYFASPERAKNPFGYPMKLDEKVQRLIEKWMGSERRSLAAHYLKVRELLRARGESLQAALRITDKLRLEHDFPSVYFVNGLDSIAFLESFLHSQLTLMKTALGLERFERAHGRLPNALEELVPAFLPVIPWDIYANAPLTYRRLPSGYFLLARRFEGRFMDDYVKSMLRNQYAIRVERPDLAAHAEEGVH